MFEYGFNGLDVITTEYAKYVSNCKVEGREPVSMWKFMRGKY